MVSDPIDSNVGGDVDCDLWSTTGPRFEEWGGTLKGGLNWAALRNRDPVLLVVAGRTCRILVGPITDTGGQARITGLGSPPF